MFVTKNNFDQALKLLTDAAEHDKFLGFDTETTCLNWWDSPWHQIKPRVFAMQFATKDKEFYFDWNYSGDKLEDKNFEILNRELFQNKDICWAIANAKFDLHHSANHGIDFAGDIHCTKAIARIVNNLEPSLSLDDLGKIYLGEGKSIDMAALCKERGYVTKVKKYGYNDKYDEILHFDKIDVDTMVEYGKIDTRRAFDLAVWQIKKILQIDLDIFKKQHLNRRLYDVLINEQKLTKILFKMEREGVLIDRKYTEEAYENEVKEYKQTEENLDRLARNHLETKIDWNSAKQLKPLFEALGEPYGYTEKGNACFDKDALEDSESQVAALILKYRHHYKRAHTYFENFIWLSDRQGILHADAQQAGTGYGRMSYWTPNLQNLPKRSDKDEATYKVRRCFIPKPGTALVDIDYDGAEYFMSMDYAREMPVVEELKAGLDPHTRLAKEMGIPERDVAKTMQFRILYGGGGMAVGRALGLKGNEANRIGLAKKKLYFERVPALATMIRSVSNVAGSRGYIFNWFGRILNYDLKTAYKAFNGLIQGGVGDMTKKAMVEIDEKILPGYQTKQLIQVHDAILFQVPLTELHLVPKLVETMATTYPHKVLPMKASPAYSLKSWADLTENVPPVA